VQGVVSAPTTKGGTDYHAVPGATVRVQGLSLQVQTGADGSFALDGVPVGQQSLVITHSGYLTVQQSVFVETGKTSALAPIYLDIATRAWTVLVYLDANNDLEPYSILNMNQMEMSSENARVAVVVQWGRAPGYDTSNGNWSGCRRYLIHHDTDTHIINSQLLEDMGSVDMGNPATLQAFITWGKAAYPAEHYSVVLWDHGDGWRSRTTAMPPVRGIAYDDIARTYIRTVDLPTALASSPPLDIVCYDACLMQMTEVAYQLRNSSNYLVGSEEDVPGEGYYYTDLLDPLVNNPDIAARDYALTIAQNTASRNNAANPYNMYTQSVVDTTQLEGVASALDAFAGEVTAASASYPTQIVTAHANAESFADPYYYDLYTFASLAKSSVPRASLGTAADNLMTALNLAVIANYHSNSRPNVHGLSIFFPDLQGYASENRLYNYTALDLAKRTRWDEWLNNSNNL